MSSITPSTSLPRRSPTRRWTRKIEPCSVGSVTGADTEARVAGDDSTLVARLRDGDERAFEEVVRDFYPSMLAVARGHTRTRAVADEVVQEAWIGVLKGLDRFEGRSSLRTWVLQIVANIARTRAVREARSLPFSAFELDADRGTPAVEPERFRGRTIRSLGTGARFRRTGGHCRSSVSSRPRPWSSSSTRSRSYPRLRRSSLPSATSAAAARSRSAMRSASARRTSGCCCTVRGRACARNSKANFDG